MKTQDITFFKMNEKEYEIYFNDKNIGYIKTMNNDWHWVFKDPINLQTYNGFDPFIKVATDNVVNQFFNISISICMKNENQMTHLKNLHLLPIIEND